METEQVSISCPIAGLALISNDTLPTELFPFHPVGLAHPPGPSETPFQKWDCRTYPLSLLALFNRHTSVLQKLEMPTLFLRCMFHKADSIRLPSSTTASSKPPALLPVGISVTEGPARDRPSCPRQSDRYADDSGAGAKKRRPPDPHPFKGNKGQLY